MTREIKKNKKKTFRLSTRIENTFYAPVLFLPRERLSRPVPILGRPAWPVCGIVEKHSVAALKFQLNNYAWRRALKRQNERALLTIKNKKGAATERKGRKEQQGSGRKRRNMSAVNNTLREIILRERPLTVTNNGSLFLSLSSSLLPSFLLSLHTLCPRLHPFVAPCMAYSPYPVSIHTRFCESFTFPMHFSATLHVHELEMRKRSWSIPAFESMNVPEKKNQAVVIGTITRLNWYDHLLRIYHDANALCASPIFFYIDGRKRS